MGNLHLILPIIFHTAFDNRLPHKHLTTFLHATMNLVEKSKYQKLRFAILKVAICTVECFDLSNSKLQFVKLKIAIRQVENCDLSSWKLRFATACTKAAKFTSYKLCHNDVILKYLESLILWSCQIDKFIMEEELKAVKNSLTRVADTLERIEGSRSGPGMSNFFEWCEH
jgi:hypothetical protein